MKNYLILLVIVVTTFITSCNKNDNSIPPIIELANEPPLSFDLLQVPDEATEVDATTALSWQSAKNPKGDEVTYDLYLGEDQNPTFLFKSGITETTFEIQEQLGLKTAYFWKVVAIDAEGRTSQSPIHKFTTRYYRIPDNPLFSESGFGARFSHASTVFDNRIWITGGYDGQVNGEVISTTDGSLYVYHDKSGGFTGFGERYFHQMLTFKNKMWVIGGRKPNGPDAIKKDIWSSENGRVWTQVTPNVIFGGKTAFGATVFDDKMWIIGGSDENFEWTNDVWYSQDGTIWTQATPVANFSKRSGHAVVTFKSKIWVIGGFDDSGAKNDVWFSSNGTAWTEATSEADFPARNGHTATVFDNKIWIVGGLVGEFGLETDDVWYSADGINWEEAQVSDAFPERAQHTAQSFRGNLWIFGGIGNDIYNDIWTLD